MTSQQPLAHNMNNLDMSSDNANPLVPTSSMTDDHDPQSQTTATTATTATTTTTTTTTVPTQSLNRISCPSSQTSQAQMQSQSQSQFQSQSQTQTEHLPHQSQLVSDSYPHKIHGLGGPAATAPFLQDFSLVAEAAKRAEMSVIMRDMEGFSL